MQKHARKKLLLKARAEPEGGGLRWSRTHVLRAGLRRSQLRKILGRQHAHGIVASRDSIEQCFRHFGYELTVHEDNRHHAIIATASRKLAPT
jgi:hypothetical protein